MDYGVFMLNKKEKVRNGEKIGRKKGLELEFDFYVRIKKI